MSAHFLNAEKQRHSDQRAAALQQTVEHVTYPAQRGSYLAWLLIFPRFSEQVDYAATAARCDCISNWIGLT